MRPTFLYAMLSITFKELDIGVFLILHMISNVNLLFKSHISGVGDERLGNDKTTHG